MGTWDYKNNDSLLNVPLLSLSRRSKMVPKRYEESTPSPSTRGKVTRSEITSWLGHIIMNTLALTQSSHHYLRHHSSHIVEPH